MEVLAGQGRIAGSGKAALVVHSKTCQHLYRMMTLTKESYTPQVFLQVYANDQ